MWKNKITFGGIWLFLVILLIFFPGFESRGLAMGLIAGYWPFLIFTRFEHSYVLITLLIMFILSGVFVLLCAMLMDKTRKYLRFVILLAIAMITGWGFIFCNMISYEEWKRTPIVQQAMDIEELNYHAPQSDYRKKIVIPQSIAGLQLGLYLASTCGGVFSVIALLARKRNTQRKTE